MSGVLASINKARMAKKTKEALFWIVLSITSHLLTGEDSLSAVPDLAHLGQTAQETLNGNGVNSCT